MCFATLYNTQELTSPSMHCIHSFQIDMVFTTVAAGLPSWLIHNWEMEKEYLAIHHISFVQQSPHHFP